jgi:hypothetical protein
VKRKWTESELDFVRLAELADTTVLFEVFLFDEGNHSRSTLRLSEKLGDEGLITEERGALGHHHQMVRRGPSQSLCLEPFLRNSTHHASFDGHATPFPCCSRGIVRSAILQPGSIDLPIPGLMFYGVPPSRDQPPSPEPKANLHLGPMGLGTPRSSGPKTKFRKKTSAGQ